MTDIAGASVLEVRLNEWDFKEQMRRWWFQELGDLCHATHRKQLVWNGCFQVMYVLTTVLQDATQFYWHTGTKTSPKVSGLATKALSIIYRGSDNTILGEGCPCIGLAEFQELTSLAYRLISIFYVMAAILSSGNVAIDKISCTFFLLGPTF